MAHGLGTGATWRMLSSKRTAAGTLIGSTHRINPAPEAVILPTGKAVADILSRLRLDRTSASKLPSLDCIYIGCFQQSVSIRAPCSRCLRSIQPFNQPSSTDVRPTALG